MGPGRMRHAEALAHSNRDQPGPAFWLVQSCVRRLHPECDADYNQFVGIVRQASPSLSTGSTLRRTSPSRDAEWHNRFGDRRPRIRRFLHDDSDNPSWHRTRDFIHNRCHRSFGGHVFNSNHHRCQLHPQLGPAHSGCGATLALAWPSPGPTSLLCPAWARSLSALAGF